MTLSPHLFLSLTFANHFAHCSRATASKASLLSAVAGSLGQLKLDCFRTHRKRTLCDLPAFDDATRRPAGPISLLLDRPRGALAVLGAAITLLALAFDPFTQQIVRYPPRSTTAPDGVAVTRRAFGIAADPGSVEFTRALNAALWEDPTQFERTLFCSSGHCDWPRFSSLGWCSKCEDATTSARLKGACSYENGVSNITCRISIGGGPEVFIVQGYPGIMKGVPPQQPWLNLSSNIVWATNDMWTPYSRSPWLWHPPSLYDVTVAGIQGPVANARLRFANVHLEHELRPPQ